MAARRSWIRVGLALGGVLLVVGVLSVRYLPAVLVHRKIQEMTSKPGRLKGLQAVPVAWEPVEPSGERVSVGFATLRLGGAREYKAEVVGRAMMVLRSPSTTITFLPPYIAEETPASESSEFRLRMAQANERARGLGELLGLSKAELSAYLSRASMKAMYPMFENGCATLETPSVSAMIVLGAEGAPVEVHVTLYSKTNSQAVGAYVTGVDAASARKIALELASGFEFERSMSEEQTNASMVEAVKSWPGSAEGS